MLPAYVRVIPIGIEVPATGAVLPAYGVVHVASYPNTRKRMKFTVLPCCGGINPQCPMWHFVLIPCAPPRMRMIDILLVSNRFRYCSRVRMITYQIAGGDNVGVLPACEDGI